MEIKPESLLKVATYIFKDLEARFHIASGMDARTHTEILYHFSLEYINLLISLRVKLDKKKPVVDSLAPVFNGANLDREGNARIIRDRLYGTSGFKKITFSRRMAGEGLSPAN